MNADAPIVHDPSRGCFELELEGHLAVLDYHRQGDLMVITHTGVPSAIGGRGVAGVLTRHALEYARGHGLKVEPACAYAAAFIQRHPQYASLLP